jgi:hypothetical protein
MTGAVASWRPSSVTDHREDPEGPEHGKSELELAPFP